jgi:iron(III) transport system substrate-binding protein
MRCKRNRLEAVGAGLALTLLLTACGGGSDDDSGSEDVAAPTIEGSAELDELVAAAQEENCLTLYGAPEEDVLRAVTDAFTEEYDVPVSFVRLVSADLIQRFSSEAEAGAVAADAILLTHSPFYQEAYDNGWLQPVSEAEIPSFPGDFPEEYTADDGATPIATLVPTTMVYNTDLVDQAPDSWEAYADPAYQGELLFAAPSSSPANVAFWAMLREEYGDEFLESVAANEPTWYNSAVPATQAVAAGEGALGFPGVAAIVKSLQDAGAPIEQSRPTPTTGPEIALGLSAESPCPNAARLFANYVLSEEGNTYLNEVSGAISPYAPEAADFVRPTPVPEEEAQEIIALLGEE